LLFTRPVHLVLCVSERTLLPVLLPARELATLGQRLAPAVSEVLRALGVPAQEVQDEERRMAEVVVGKTVSRQVLGSMTDFAWLLDAHLDWRALVDISAGLADTPCSPLVLSNPREATVELFRRGSLSVVK